MEQQPEQKKIFQELPKEERFEHLASLYQSKLTKDKVEKLKDLSEEEQQEVFQSLELLKQKENGVEIEQSLIDAAEARLHSLEGMN